MNNIWNYSIIVAVFIAIFGTMINFGEEALISNPNIDSESISKIANLDDELYTDFEVNSTTGEISGRLVSENLAFNDGAAPEEREILESREDLTNAKISTDGLTNIPSQVVNSIWFLSFDDAGLYLGILAAIIALALFIMGYKFVRRGEADNS